MLNRTLPACVNLVALTSATLLAHGCRTAQPKPQPAPPPMIVAPQPVAAVEQPPAPVAPAPPAVIDDGAPVAVNVQVEALVGDGPAAFVPTGQRLRSGDRIAIHVTPNANAYLYVALVSSTGEPQLLFPAQGPGVIMGGTSERIPPVGKWFRLDKSTGQEDIYVLAAKRPTPVEEILARAKADADSDRKTAAAKATKKPPVKKGRKHATMDVPGAVTSETRSLELVDDPAPQAGVTKKHFSIRHGE
jgi:hypothetical protein